MHCGVSGLERFERAGRFLSEQSDRVFRRRHDVGLERREGTAEAGDQTELRAGGKRLGADVMMGHDPHCERWISRFREAPPPGANGEAIRGRRERGRRPRPNA